MTDFLCLPGHMCDERLWSAVPLPGNVLNGDLTLGENVTGMAEAVLRASPLRFVAIGLSMGGIVALQIARLAPERLTGLVLLDTNPSADTDEKRKMRSHQQRRVREGKLAQIVVEELKPNYLARANRQRRDLLDLTLDMSLRLGPDVFIRQAEALKTRPDAWSVLPTLTMPVLAACGAEDRLCPPELHQRIARACPRADLSIIEGAGHLTALEAPEALGSVIAAWAAAEHQHGAKHG